MTAAPTVAESGGKVATEKECHEFADTMIAAAKVEDEVKVGSFRRTMS